jgi:hypothetical protein
LGGKDKEDGGSKPARVNSLRDPILKKKKKKKKKNKKKGRWSGEKKKKKKHHKTGLVEWLKRHSAAYRA